MDKNKVTYGLRNVLVAFHKDDGTFDIPTSIAGVVGWTPTAVGDTSDFYADDGIFYSINANNGYTGDLTMAKIDDEIVAKMLGWDIDDNGALVENADGKPTHFAMIFEVQGDLKPRRTVYYDCLASRPAKAENTKGETITVNPDIYNLKVVSKDFGGKPIVKATLELNDTNKTVFDAFNTAVYTPLFTGA